MRKNLETNERLIVAADFDPVGPLGRVGAKDKIEDLVMRLRDTGVIIKVNSDLRVWGFDLINFIHRHGLKCFADFKLCDIEATMSRDGAMLSQISPAIVTVMAQASAGALKALKARLPKTEVLAVTVLTDISDEDVASTYGMNVPALVLALANKAHDAGLDGLVCSPSETSLLRPYFPNMTINTPGIRPTWHTARGDQKRVATPAQAIASGADRIVIGRPIVEAVDPRTAVMQTLKEIAESITSNRSDASR